MSNMLDTENNHSGQPSSPTNDEIRRSVEQMEMLAARAPLVILAFFVGVPLIINLALGRVGAGIINGILMFVVGGLVVKFVNSAVLGPMRSMRYKGAAKKLERQVQALSEPVTLWRSWWAIAPGALAITRPGHVVIIDQSTGYEHLWLAKGNIVNVSVERQATQITNTKHGGRFTLGGASRNGLFGGYTFGGRSRSITQTVETAFLEIRYQLERNGAVYTSVMPFGSDRRSADELCAAITRIEHSV